MAFLYRHACPTSQSHQKRAPRGLALQRGSKTQQRKEFGPVSERIGSPGRGGDLFDPLEAETGHGILFTQLLTKRGHRDGKTLVWSGSIE